MSILYIIIVFIFNLPLIAATIQQQKIIIKKIIISLEFFFREEEEPLKLKANIPMLWPV
jgi:hypothetical protein